MMVYEDFFETPRSTVNNYLWAHHHSFVAPQFAHTLVWEA